MFGSSLLFYIILTSTFKYVYNASHNWDSRLIESEYVNPDVEEITRIYNSKLSTYRI